MGCAHNNYNGLLLMHPSPFSATSDLEILIWFGRFFILSKNLHKMQNGGMWPGGELYHGLDGWGLTSSIDARYPRQHVGMLTMFDWTEMAFDILTLS